MARFALLSAAFFLFVSGFFVAKIQTEPIVAQAAGRVGMEATSSIFVLLLALPSYWALVRWLGWKRGVLTLLVLGAFAVAIETLAVYTGFPYGQFAHGEKIGAKLFGAVPWTVPFAWTPLVLASMALASRTRWELPKVLLLSALILVSIDLLLDPAAVAQGFWEYHYPSAYYGVPLSNFAGWLVSGLIGSAIFAKMAGIWPSPRPLTPSAKLLAEGVRGRGEGQIPAGLITSGFLVFTFWTSVALWMGLVIPALIGLGLTAVAGYFCWRGDSLLRSSSQVDDDL